MNCAIVSIPDRRGFVVEVAKLSSYIAGHDPVTTFEEAGHGWRE
jgi:hypothetical protein